MEPWIIIDTPNIAHRAYHGCYWMRSMGISTGAIYGVLRDIQFLQGQFGTDPSKMIFCFDGHGSIRKKIFPGYKMVPSDTEEKKSVRSQLTKLMESILPKIGIKNVFWQDGYEADDIIANCITEVLYLEDDADIVLVSSDKDLYQLLSDSVKIWCPHRRASYTLHDFTQEWRITTSQWKQFKALAGCRTDTISGLVGCGEGTALSFLSGRAYRGRARGRHINTLKKIEQFMETEEYKLFLRLVSLPLDEGEGLNKFPISEEGCINKEQWNEVCEEYKLKSLLNFGEDDKRARRVLQRRMDRGER